jgi:hypothetical protein
MLRKIPNPNKIPIPMHILDLLGSIGIIWDNLGSMHNKTNNLGFFVYIFKKGSLIGMIGIISEKT